MAAISAVPPTIPRICNNVSDLRGLDEYGAEVDLEAVT